MTGESRERSSLRTGGESDVGPWTVVGTRTGGSLMLFDARIDTVLHPRTGRAYDRVVLQSPDWVNVIAVTADERCVMVKQYRFGTRETTLEIPGGMVDAGETPEEAARRELLEETGFGASEWSLLATVRPNPAFLDNTCHHFLARDAVRRRPPQRESGEDIAVELTPLADLAELVASGVIDHSLVISALSRVLDLRGPGAADPSAISAKQALDLPSES